MKVFPFERSGDLMLITARVEGGPEYREVLLVIDTGAAATSIEPAILEGLGEPTGVGRCGARAGELRGIQQLRDGARWERPA
jgi:hypothetical protein